jgi:NCS1 family nucleobase:cation symporter-1
VLGGFAILSGLNVFWAIIAMLVGNILGAGFTALHAIQGPRVGVPQMI